jgi:phosphoenolpyruvate synthase/pyruvate phosphate dikinase
VRMRKLGFPVPEGFIITTKACVSYIRSGPQRWSLWL